MLRPTGLGREGGGHTGVMPQCVLRGAVGAGEGVANEERARVRKKARPRGAFKRTPFAPA